MTRQWRVLVVGCGWVSRRAHLPYLARLHQTGRLRALHVADTDAGRASAAARDFGARPYHGPLADAPADVVVVATPPASHARLTIGALASGAHVIVEKPLALTADDAASVLAASACHGRGVYPLYTSRHRPEAHLIQLLPGGDGGALLVRDAATARRAEMIANCGRPRGSSSYAHEVIGTNARISVFAAALVLAQAPALDRMWQLRDRRRAQLAAALDQAGHGSLLIGPHPRVTRHDHYAVLMRAPAALAGRGIHAATLAAALTAEGIPAKALFPPWQATPAYTDSPRCGAIRTPHAGHAAATVIALPHPLLLDPHVADDTTAALTKITACAGDLLAWQDGQRQRPALAAGGRA